MKSDVTETIRHELTQMVEEKADAFSEQNKKDMKALKVNNKNNNNSVEI